MADFNLGLAMADFWDSNGKLWGYQWPTLGVVMAEVGGHNGRLWG